MPSARAVVGVVLAISLSVACAVAAQPARANPLAGQALWADAGSPPADQANAWRRERPGDARLMARLAATPQAIWVGDWTWNLRREVGDNVAGARRANATPVFVAYNIPGRDCGMHSAGGAGSARGYRAWVRRLAAALGRAHAVVILEPDALAWTGCLRGSARRQRLALLRYAVAVLARRTRAVVYIDAGHSAWQPASVMARRLRAAGVARARGFSLNVANFRRTDESVAYGASVASRIRGEQGFVVDVSRNGNGPADGEWCNPPGRALGQDPTTASGLPGVDALLWVKRPGESDGPCNGGPPSGQWWADYALRMARAAGW